LHGSGKQPPALLPLCRPRCRDQRHSSDVAVQGGYKRELQETSIYVQQRQDAPSPHDFRAVLLRATQSRQTFPNSGGQCPRPLHARWQTCRWTHNIFGRWRHLRCSAERLEIVVAVHAVAFVAAATVVAYSAAVASAAVAAAVVVQRHPHFNLTQSGAKSLLGRGAT